jgi:hypothetical protein
LLTQIEFEGTDGCTAAPEFDFVSCCYMHDKDYEEQRISRKEADLRFRYCVSYSRTAGVAWFYWGAVRAVGWIFWLKHKWRKQHETDIVNSIIERNTERVCSLERPPGGVLPE